MRALGLSQAGLCFELDTPVCDSGRYRSRPCGRDTNKKEDPQDFWSQLWKGTETFYSPQEHWLLGVCPVLLQRESLRKEHTTAASGLNSERFGW